MGSRWSNGRASYGRGHGRRYLLCCGGRESGDKQITAVVQVRGCFLLFILAARIKALPIKRPETV